MSSFVVLIVEDEPLLRMDAADIVMEAGHQVVEAANADEALVILEGRSDIGMVFTDIEMPGSMNGLKLAFAVRERWPPVIIVVASGRVTPDASELPENVRFLKKPYRPSDIRDALKTAA